MTLSNKSSLSSIKNLFIFILFLNINLYSQENTALTNFKTMLIKLEKAFSSPSCDYIKKVDNNFFRIESRILLNLDKASVIKTVGMYSIYDNRTNESLGYLNYIIIRSNDCHINELHINPKYRNKKIGQLLSIFAIEKFKENKIKTLTLTPSPFNENQMSEDDLIKCYERFGFRKLGTSMYLQLNNHITSKL